MRRVTSRPSCALCWPLQSGPPPSRPPDTRTHTRARARARTRARARAHTRPRAPSQGLGDEEDESYQQSVQKMADAEAVGSIASGARRPSGGFNNVWTKKGDGPKSGWGTVGEDGEADGGLTTLAEASAEGSSGGGGGGGGANEASAGDAAQDALMAQVAALQAQLQAAEEEKRKAQAEAEEAAQAAQLQVASAVAAEQARAALAMNEGGLKTLHDELTELRDANGGDGEKKIRGSTEQDERLALEAEIKARQVIIPLPFLPPPTPSLRPPSSAPLPHPLPLPLSSLLWPRPP